MLSTTPTTVTTHEGWFSRNASLTFSDDPNQGWRMDPGARFVIVVYSSSRPNPKTFDRGVFNDELAVEVDPEAVVAGAKIDLAKNPVRYQRGSTVLTYESLAVAGTLFIDRFDGKTLGGRVELSASAPRLDLLAQGDVSTSATFEFSKL